MHQVQRTQAGSGREDCPQQGSCGGPAAKQAYDAASTPCRSKEDKQEGVGSSVGPSVGPSVGEAERVCVLVAVYESLDRGVWTPGESPDVAGLSPSRPGAGISEAWNQSTGRERAHPAAAEQQKAPGQLLSCSQPGWSLVTSSS